MKRKLLNNKLAVLFIMIIFFLTLLFPIIFGNYIASAENFFKNVDNVPFLTV